MATLLNVYDRATRKKAAVLQNAYNIVETQEINQIYSLSFTLPQEDVKNKYCQPRHYIRYGDTGELYRIKSPKVQDNNVGTIVYECEHVITTLCDDIMFGSFVYGGRGTYTSDVISWILSKQKTANWRLGTCAFARQFEYGWEQENLLNALYSIPREFTSSYMWTFNTTSYPWTLNLVEIDKNATPEYYLRAKSNLLSSGSAADYANICTRIYPLGYGEGVNQLTIKDATVNANGDAVESGGTKWGKTYIESPQSYIDKYGIVEKVLVDRRFEYANSLYGYAKQTLEVYQEPTMSRSFDVTDLYPITNKPLDDAQVGKICKMTQDNTVAYITKTQRQWDQAGNLQIDLSTKATDITSSIADLADRIRIESVYAQGATQLYQHSKDANATPSKGMILSLYFPSEMKQINKVLLRLKLEKFRSYSDTTTTQEEKTYTSQSMASTQSTSSSGGGSVATSTSGGSSAQTGATAGASGISGSVTSAAVWAGDSSFASTTGYSGYTSGGTTGSASGGSHTHSIPGLLFTVGETHIYKYSLAHSHSVNLPTGFGSHSHSISFSSHSHKVTIPSHTHKFTVPEHNHKVTIPAHSHKIIAGIYESGNPSSFSIYIRDTKKASVSSTSYDGDITEWLLDDNNQVPRDSWIDLKIVPNDNAYVVASVFVQGFVQSRGGGNY